jgi:hypothetical protein
MLRQDNYGGAGPLLADLPRCLQSLSRLGGRHPDVRQHYVRAQRGDKPQQPLRVRGGAGHLHPGLGQHPAQALAQGAAPGAVPVTGMGSAP